jgi:hypothetical protein
MLSNKRYILIYYLASMPKDSCRIIINYIGLLLSLLGYLKTSLTLGNFLPLIYTTTLL